MSSRPVIIHEYGIGEKVFQNQLRLVTFLPGQYASSAQG